MVIDNRFLIMQKPETLAQLICRTVLEFEQRQATLQQEKLLEIALNSPNIKASSQNISKESKSLRLNFKNKTA